MIITALANYYDQLLQEHPDKVARPGWSSKQVQGIIELAEDGSLRGIVPSEEKKGFTKLVPAQEKRAYGIAPNFLCDTAAYLLGIPKDAGSEKDIDRSRKCFEASRQKHHKILDGVDSPCAKAVLAFMDSWSPAAAMSNDAIHGSTS